MDNLRRGSLDERASAAVAEVLVELDLHRMRSSDVDRSLPRHLRAKGNAGAKVLRRELRIIFQDLIHRHPASKEVQDQRDPNPMPPDTRLSAADIGIYRNALQEVVMRHCGFTR